MQRVAIIGVSEQYRSANSGIDVDCFGWRKVGSIQNASDYDTVIVNLLSLKDHDEPDWKAFFETFTLQTVAEIVGHHGEIIIIGDPRFSVRWYDSPKDWVDHPFLHWTGIEFEWDERPGKKAVEQFNDYHDRNAYDPYLSNLNTWSYSLRSFKTRNNRKLQEAFGFTEWLNDNPEYKLGIRRDTFYATRFGALIAGRFVFVVFAPSGHRKHGMKDYEAVATFGSIVLLPATRLDSEVSLRTILRDVIGVDIGVSAPEWAEVLVAPGQAAIDNDLSRIKGQLTELVAQFEAREEERRASRAPIRLLYSKDTDLEEAVRDAFVSLGASVTVDEERKNEEDGLVSVNGIEQLGVLEAKGTTRSSFQESFLRQLQDWVSRAFDRGVEAPKGIFVGNSSIESPPEMRSSPFEHNFVKSATNRSFAVMRSEDLYSCYCLDQQGELDREEFWRNLFATRGVFDAREYQDAFESLVKRYRGD